VAYLTIVAINKLSYQTTISIPVQTAIRKKSIFTQTVPSVFLRDVLSVLRSVDAYAGIY
jgi:hypothetical protein